MKADFHRKFKKKLRKLPISIQDKFYERLRMFYGDPFSASLNNHSVDRVYPGCRSINVTGDYRAIFSEAGDSVLFVNIGTHAELYG
ncbi:MAG: type II toxin-antitoxin system mRNA interferase toxin, RelE/StbE family [Patescibacteria group bacterium]|nr:type II toxin-antitoxin system mRNA interferase toxin, RelE/StbE family [Patescibacteria group bacterium]